MDLEKRVRDYVEQNMPTEVQVPTGVSEAEAIQQVKKQFSDAGAFDCSDGTAREIVHHAWDKAKRDGSDRPTSDEQAGDADVD